MKDSVIELTTNRYLRDLSNIHNRIHCQTLGHAKGQNCCDYWCCRICCQMTCFPSSWRGHSGWLRRSVYQRVPWYISFKDSTLFDDSCRESISSLKDGHEREPVSGSLVVLFLLIVILIEPPGTHMPSDGHHL